MPILLIDGLNLIRRVHAGVPEVSEDRDEAVLNACVASVRRALRKHQPSHAVLVMEEGGPSWRSREYPDYKRDRPPMPDDLVVGLPKIKDAFSEIGVHELSAPGFEADDVIASIAKRTSGSGFQVIILSTDKSFCQLASSRIILVDHFNNTVRNRAWIQERYGVAPEQMVDLMSLAGDPSLGIPGIRSVGVRTAARLIDDFGDLDSVIDHARDIPGKLGEKLRQGVETLPLMRRLVSLRQDLELGSNLHDFRWSEEMLASETETSA